MSLQTRLAAAQDDREVAIIEAQREASFRVALYGWASSRTEEAIRHLAELQHPAR